MPCPLWKHRHAEGAFFDWLKTCPEAKTGSEISFYKDIYTTLTDFRFFRFHTLPLRKESLATPLWKSSFGQTIVFG